MAMRYQQLVDSGSECGWLTAHGEVYAVRNNRFR
jgi:hypothetical protein